MNKANLIIGFGIIGLLGSTPCFSVQEIEVPDWQRAVEFQLVASQEPLRPGDKLELAVLAEIEPGYHLYGPEERKPSRTVVHFESDELRASDPQFPPVIRRDLAGLGEFDLYEGRVAIRIPATVLEAAANSLDIAIKVHINYQVCTDSACSAPTSKELSLRVPIAKKGAEVKSLHREIFARQ